MLPSMTRKSYEKLQEDEHRIGRDTQQPDDMLQRSADGSFLDPQLETAFKASFFRTNCWFHIIAICTIFWPAFILIMQAAFEDIGEWKHTPSATSMLVLPPLVMARLCLHKVGDQAKAQRVVMGGYLVYIVLLYVPDIVMIFIGTNSMDATLASLQDPGLVSAITISSTVMGFFQGSLGPSLSMNVSLCLLIAFDNVLNTFVLIREGHVEDITTLATIFLAQMFGVCSMRVYELVLRTNHVNEEMRLRAQEQLASYLFHELRNHQNVQSGMLDLIGEHTERSPHEPLSANDAELVAEARVHAWQAARIISNMLDFTKLRAGRLKLSSEPFALEGFLRECVLLVRHMVRQKPDLLLEVRMDVEAPRSSSKLLEVRMDVGASPLQLVGPVHLLKQVVINLLTNAIKYTASGHVLLRASLSGPHDEHVPPIMISVEDTGSGIPTDKLTTIFKPFEQGYKPGTGLGLPLCNDVLNTMGSKLEVSQPSSGGSVFSFMLKCSVAPAEWDAASGDSTGLHGSVHTSSHGPASGDATAASLPGPALVGRVAMATGSSDPGRVGAYGGAIRVLVADDIRLNRVMLIRRLREVMPHALITEALDGEGALSTLSSAACAAAPFDIAFLDEHYLPNGLTGMEVTRRYREIEASCTVDNSTTAQRLVIVGCSGSAGIDGHNQAAHKAGQDLVFGKPLPTAAQMSKLLQDVRPNLFAHPARTMVGILHN